MKLINRGTYLTKTWLLFVFLLALMASFFMHYRVNGFIVMIIIIVGVIQFIIKPIPFSEIGFILLMPALFFMIVVGQLYTNNLNVGWTLVERSLSILLLPFAIIPVKYFTLTQGKMLMNFFILVGVLTAAYCISVQVLESYNSGSIYTVANSHHFSFNRFMHHKLSAPINLHAVYFSLYLAIMAIYVFRQAINVKMSTWLKIGVVCLFLFFIGVIFLLKSAIISFGFTVVIIMMLWQKLRNHKGRFRFVLSLLSIVIAAFAIISVKSKVEFVNLNYDMTDPNMGMLAIRLSIWENTWSIIQSNWLLGVGTGDADELLIKQYNTAGFAIGYENDYNCHNMYLQYWLGNGVLALGIFITYLILLLKKAIKNKNMIFVGFLIVFTLFSFTESTMRVQKGMVFFMFFSSLFYWKPTLWSNSR